MLDGGLISGLATGGGGGLIGAIATWAQLRQSKRDREDSREKRLQELYEKIMEEVRAENADLHAEVEECKRRDARVLVIETCFRMVMPELLRQDPFNRTLAQVSGMLRGLPVLPNDGEWNDLLAKIDEADMNARSKRPE